MDPLGVNLPAIFLPATIILGLVFGIGLLLRNSGKPDWLDKLSKRLNGDTTTDAPPPEVSKKKKKGK